MSKGSKIIFSFLFSDILKRNMIWSIFLLTKEDQDLFDYLLEDLS